MAVVANDVLSWCLGLGYAMMIETHLPLLHRIDSRLNGGNLGCDGAA
jgi:hypothetical protein